MIFWQLMIELLLKFIEQILKLDPNEVTVAEMVKQMKGKKFRDWYAKQKV